MTSPGLLAEWAQWMKAAGMSTRTITDRVQLVARFEAACSVQSVIADWQDLAGFLGSDHFQPGTRQTYHAHLKAWFHWLVLMDHRETDPTIKLRSPKAPKRKPRPITLAQLSRILNTRMHRRTRAMVLLGAYEGFRVSEIARVRGSDLRGEEIEVLGKGGRQDKLPVHDLVAEVAATMPRTGFWFPSHVKLGPITGKSVSAILSDLMDRAGVPGTPHCLRHFYGTECLKTKGNLAVVRQLMRHENLATTALYTEVEDAEMRATIKALPVPLRVV